MRASRKKRISSQVLVHPPKIVHMRRILDRPKERASTFPMVWLIMIWVILWTLACQESLPMHSQSHVAQRGSSRWSLTNSQEEHGKYGRLSTKMEEGNWKPEPTNWLHNWQNTIKYFCLTWSRQIPSRPKLVFPLQHAEIHYILPGPVQYNTPQPSKFVVTECCMWRRS